MDTAGRVFHVKACQSWFLSGANMETSLTDKVVIITGASSGIGAAAAAAFARVGARVALAARSADRLKKLAERLGGSERALAVPTDVTQAEECDRLARLTRQHFGRVDILVNNAGIGHWARFSDLTETETRHVLEVNVLGVMNAIHAVLPGMRRQRSGTLINVASMVAHMGIPMNSVYCATKFAVRGLSQSLRLELAGDGIEVVCFCPGHTDSEFFQHSVVRGARWHHGLLKPMSPDEAARRLVAAAIRPRPEVVLTTEGRAMTFAARHFPQLAAWGAKLFFHRNDNAGRGSARMREWDWSKHGLQRK